MFNFGILSNGFVTSLCPAVPNPPGPLHILAKTNSSIDIEWQESPLMTVGSFHYRLSITSPGGGVNFFETNATNLGFAPLLSGTPYNISVRTVGALGFESEEVQINMVNTSKSFGPLLEKQSSDKLWIWIYTRLSSLTTRTFQREKSERVFSGRESDHTGVGSS